MKKVLLLATTWQADYWESDKEAPYRKNKYTDIPEWDDLSESCPLPGIGRYTKRKDKDFCTKPFVYLIITGMRYDSSTESPFFTFRTLTKSKKESRILESNIPSVNRRLFSVMDPEKFIAILQDIGETPPKEWKSLINIKEQIIHWKNYIGEYFLEIEEKTLSNNEFENRIAALFNALGFKVNQKGHRLPGEYPDGIASFDSDYAIVYDCKNTDNFISTSQDQRAIKKYLEDEKRIRNENNIYCAFIAKSSKMEGKRDIFYLPMNSLLYLSYKKLILGAGFSLSPFKKILHDSIPFNDKIIDKEWRK